METVSDMIAGFLAGLTPGTRAQYRSVVSRWLRWCADNGIDMLRSLNRRVSKRGSVIPRMMKPVSNVWRTLAKRICC